jgi:hypothetical protein
MVSGSQRCWTTKRISVWFSVKINDEQISTRLVEQLAEKNVRTKPARDRSRLS